MTITFIAPGKPVITPSGADPELEAFGLRVETAQAVQIETATRGLGQETAIDADDADVFELEYENGVREWVRADELRDRLAPLQRRSAEPDQPVYIPAALTASATRGGGEMTLAALRLLRVEPLDVLLDALADVSGDLLARPAVKLAVAHFESWLDPAPGLYRLDARGQFGADERVTAELPPCDDPYLLFIHGTFSSTQGSFRNLFLDPESDIPTPEWETLRQRYAGRLLGLEHRTLSQSPAQNALELIRWLPRGATLHLVTHSRGGLVGELLTLTHLDDPMLAHFGDARAGDVETLRALIRSVREKEIGIERFVRVACPARGTTLASKRLDRYLSVILNVIGWLPPVQASLIYPFAKATILSLIKSKAEPHELPGLEAMMPNSPFIALLNHDDARSDTALAAIAGDVEGGDLLQRLGILATDFFYRAEHDFVVQTASMFKGVERRRGVYYSFEKGPAITHFNYFRNHSSRQRIHDWLTHPTGQPPASFKKLTGKPIPELVRSRLRAPREDAATLFFLPGWLATHLQQGDQRIWLDLHALAAGALGQLAAEEPETPVLVDEVNAAQYQRLLTYLANRYHVQPFPYDWRRSMLDAAANLAVELESELRNHNRPVHLLAHSSGGLVARTLIAQHGELWRRMVRRGGRLVMLGTPNGGASVALQLLTGRGRLAQTLALLDPARDAGAVAEIFRGFDGLLELLPDAPEVREDGWWQEHGVKYKRDRTALLKRIELALKMRAQLDRAIDGGHMRCVAGASVWTPDRLGGDGGDESGDGLVSCASVQLEGVPIWYLDAAHGELTSREAAFPALVELLERGETDLLPRSRGARGRIVRHVRPVDQPLLYPTDEELTATALGSRARAQVPDAAMALQVSVMHGSIEYARHPIAVGHYEGDVIVGAERTLDDLLDGRLSLRRNMNLYPGQVGTVDIVAGNGDRCAGAIIVGLGEVGQVTPEKVTRGVTEAALRLALLEVERAPGDRPDTWRSAAFSSVLIGSGGRALSVESSLGAVTKGALLANRILRQQGLWDRVRVDAVEFIEIYEDIAIHAARALQSVQQHVRLILDEDEGIESAAQLRVIEGGMQGQPVDEYSTGWWRRLQISEISRKQSEQEAGGLKFVALTDRARAEQTLQATQRKLVNQFVTRAIHESAYREELPATLYELLLPNALKDQSQEIANLLLVLDSHAARYPWEMLAERKPDGGLDPIAVRMGLIRQLTTEQFRTQVQPPRGRNALVVGDPRLRDRTRYPPLPGAQAEARAVQQQMETCGYQVIDAVETDALDIVNKLFRTEYRVLHIAGHGIYNEEQPHRSGLVIGDDMFLTAAEVAQLRVTPDIVFLNCCYLAQMDRGDADPEDETAAPDRERARAWNDLAASVAEELIKSGVRAVVAAGWAVDDRAARTFAIEFYAQMLEFGQQFGEAVRRARAATYEQHPATNTWGAYQCYGDPAFSLVAHRPAQPRPEREHVAEREVIRALQDIQTRAQQPDPALDATPLVERVRTIDRTVPAAWRRGTLLYHLGAAYSELGRFGHAIRIYRETLALEAQRAESSDVPIRLIEQLGNLEVRYARQLQEQGKARADQGIRDTPEELLQMAGERLNWLLGVLQTAEQYALVGSRYKRIAQAAGTDEMRRDALEKGHEHYRKAHERSLQPSAPSAYHTLNWLTFEFLLAEEGVDESTRQEWLELIRQCEDAAMRAEARAPSFWNRIAGPDAALLRALIEGDVAAQEEALRERFLDVLRSRATARERSTVAEHLAFLRDMLTRRGQEDLAGSLRRLHAAVEAAAS
jgi:CHAT domain-containing protein/pimeloyl-ACP methyl ester carboxylesterase